MILIIQSLIFNMQNVLNKNKGKEKILINLISLISQETYSIPKIKRNIKFEIYKNKYK